jgi:hypothetical protein
LLAEPLLRVTEPHTSILYRLQATGTSPCSMILSFICSFETKNTTF